MVTGANLQKPDPGATGGTAQGIEALATHSIELHRTTNARPRQVMLAGSTRMWIAMGSTPGRSAPDDGPTRSAGAGGIERPRTQRAAAQ